MKILTALCVGLVFGFVAHAGYAAGDENWSRQFKKPQSIQKLLPGTGMVIGDGKPLVRRVKWHDGKLWMSGAWAPGVKAEDITKRESNALWHLWTWSPEHGYEAVGWFHTLHGGAGPDGQIYDFLWLPDGRLVVGGAFTRVDNPTGTRYHRVNGVAIYDPNEPTANKWQPLGMFQYNGTVSPSGSVESIGYDSQGNDLYVGGTFAGILAEGSENQSPKIHRYDFDTQSYEPLSPGVNGVKARVRRIKVDESTSPSTIYMSGRFQFTAGNGVPPTASNSTARWSPGIAKHQAGVGWTTFPEAPSIHDEDTLQRAADFMHFDSVHVLDFLIDGEDLWIVGAFSEGKASGETLRGIAKWDAAGQKWIDPTGKGGVGREIWSIAKAENGKIYFAGAFGGLGKSDGNFDGFRNGDEAHLAISFDPATGEWAQLGSGLLSLPFPEVRMTVDGNDVYYVGDFNYIGMESDKSPDMESFFIARWNETIDFTANPAEVAAAPTPSPKPDIPEQPLFEDNDGWSRGFAPPPRRSHPDKVSHTAKTGFDVGTGPPDPTGIAWLDDTLYFTGNYPATPKERWYVWSYHQERGYEKLAWEEMGKTVGADAVPSGLKIHEGKVWVYGGLPSFKGIAIYDPATRDWSPFSGTWNGQDVIGHAVAQGGGTIRDIDWDSKTGEFYMVGATGLENPDYEYPGDVAAVIRVDAEGTYHPMGHDIKPEDPGKPKKRFDSIYLDETAEPTDIYIGGTFAFNGPAPSKTDMRVYNVAKWDHDAQDWGPIGSGIKPAWVDRDHFPNGYPGLPALPNLFGGFLRTDFPSVRDLTMDGDGNLYAAGTLAVLDLSLPVKDRKETFGLARWNRETDRWEGPTDMGGFSRDPLEMTWLDDGRTQMLLTGAFEYDNAWRPLNGVAILDVTTGEVSGLGGGLMLSHRDQVVAPMVRHALRGDEMWFTGLFDHAGVNANATFAAPIPASHLAMYDPGGAMDPNAGLVVKAIEPLPAPTSSSKAYRIELEAELTEGEGEIAWWEPRSGGKFHKAGTGSKFRANPRARKSDTEIVYYVSVIRPDGTEGGKIPVRIPLVPAE